MFKCNRYILGVMLFTAICMAAVPTMILTPSSYLREEHCAWTAVGTSPETIIAEDFYLEYLAFSTGGTGRTVTATDRQGSAVTWLTAVSLSANQLTVITIPHGRAFMKSGIVLSASGSGVVFQMSGRVRR